MTIVVRSFSMKKMAAGYFKTNCLAVVTSPSHKMRRLLRTRLRLQPLRYVLKALSEAWRVPIVIANRERLPSPLKHTVSVPAPHYRLARLI
jgi:hypothetical protein